MADKKKIDQKTKEKPPAGAAELNEEDLNHAQGGLQGVFPSRNLKVGPGSLQQKNLGGGIGGKMLDDEELLE